MAAKRLPQRVFIIVDNEFGDLMVYRKVKDAREEAKFLDQRKVKIGSYELTDEETVEVEQPADPFGT